ncbi:hypothetical protein BHE74_00013431 [Ensete ventricosum]|nr:hypothetical protein BHE74_00013431 [Ensete ventricosum]
MSNPFCLDLFTIWCAPKIFHYCMAHYGVNFSNDCIFQVCSKAIEPGNKNRRLNTSIVICYVNSVGRFNILVDAGKYASNITMFSLTFFYHSALRWFPVYGLRNIDAVIITHSHADAIGVILDVGLDDLRDWTNNVQPFIPIYVAQRDFEV